MENSSLTIEFKRLPYNDLPLPKYQTAGAAGFDLHACLISDALTQRIALDRPHELVRAIFPGDSSLIDTGFAVALPSGYELQIRPRSGFAIKNKVIILNSPGTVDEDYRGEIKIGLMNLGREPLVLRHGDRIAQAVLAPVVRANFQEVTSLSVTQRGESGFGSTGIR
jgi:dUTP pyrophosphatase